MVGGGENGCLGKTIKNEVVGKKWKRIERGKVKTTLKWRQNGFKTHLSGLKNTKTLYGEGGMTEIYNIYHCLHTIYLHAIFNIHSCKFQNNEPESPQLNK